ncbi:MAG: ABC transporter substrate-binding protein, partial [Clostridia bacterium]|nr:ABC transporter substrate-binding protein [Clostridia bacterium]
MKKKIVALALSMIMTAGVLAGCKGAAESTESSASAGDNADKTSESSTE